MDMRGRYLKSPEHRAKLADAARRQAAARKDAGLPAANLGVPMSEETRRRMSEGHRGNRNAQTHGMTNTPTHNSWRDMLARCREPGSFNYPRYGGRGITVCDRWLRLDVFYADMGERPAGKTLDRIEKDGNYEPGNVRWATAKEQAANRSRPTRRRTLTPEQRAAASVRLRTAWADGRFANRRPKGGGAHADDSQEDHPV